MLVLSRKTQEQIRVGDHITISVLKIKGNTVRIGIEAPREVRVLRGELPIFVVADGAETSEDAASQECASATDDEPGLAPQASPSLHAFLRLRRRRRTLAAAVAAS